MRFDDIYLAGIGTYLPDRVTTEEAVEGAGTTRPTARSSGMRACGAGELPAPDLAVGRRRRPPCGAPATDVDDFGALLHSAHLPPGPRRLVGAALRAAQHADRPITRSRSARAASGMLAGLSSPPTGWSPSRPRRRPADHRRQLLHAAGRPLERPRGCSCSRTAARPPSCSRRGGFARLLAVELRLHPDDGGTAPGGEQLSPPGITVGRVAQLRGARRLLARGSGPPAAPRPPGHLGELVAAGASTARSRPPAARRRGSESATPATPTVALDASTSTRSASTPRGAPGSYTRPGRPCRRRRSVHRPRAPVDRGETSRGRPRAAHRGRSRHGVACAVVEILDDYARARRRQLRCWPAAPHGRPRWPPLPRARTGGAASPWPDLPRAWADEYGDATALVAAIERHLLRRPRPAAWTGRPPGSSGTGVRARRPDRRSSCRTSPTSWSSPSRCSRRRQARVLA